MKILRKNQIIIFALAVMLVTAGYLTTTGVNKNQDVLMASSNIIDNKTNDETIGDAKLVNGGAIVSNDEMENVSTETSATANNDDYFASSKLERDNMYSQQLDSYQKIIESNTISSEQKAIAENEIKKINDNKNAIMIIENLIKTKGFEDIVIFINGDSVNAVVKAEKLSQEQIAQIQNIISREMNTDINNIHITNK